MLLTLLTGDDRQAGLGRLNLAGGLHGALALEDHALGDADARRRDVANDLGLVGDFEPLVREGVPFNRAADDYLAADDVGPDGAGLVHNDGVLALDTAFDLALNADRAFRVEFPLHLRARPDDCGHIVFVECFAFVQHVS